MSDVSLHGSELLQWSDETATQWFKFLTENPAVFALPCDIAGTHSVAELMQHVTAVELRYAERLAGQPVTEYEQIPYGSVDEIAATHRKAHALFEGLLSDPDFDWTKEIEFATRTSGTLSASRRKIFFHAQLHGIRHYAQLATLARQHGHKPKWMMDLLVTRALV